MTSHRVKVTLPEDVFSAVDRLAQASQSSRSSVVSGLLTPNIKPINDLAESFENTNMLDEALPDGAKSVFEHLCQNVPAGIVAADSDQNPAASPHLLTGGETHLPPPI